MNYMRTLSIALLAVSMAPAAATVHAQDYVDANGASVASTDGNPAMGGGNGEQAVHDAKAYGLQQEQARTMQDQLEQLRSQMSELQKQTDEARRQNEAITGSSGKGQLATGDYKDSAPRNWRETLNASASIGPVSDTANDMKQELERQSQELANASDEESAEKSMELGVMRSLNGSALNATSYNASIDRIDRLKQLQEKIDNASTLKEIVDLQARIQIENGMMTNELLRTQSMNAMLQQTEYANAYQSMKDMAIRSDSNAD